VKKSAYIFAKLLKRTNSINCGFQRKWTLVAVKHRLLFLFKHIMITWADYILIKTVPCTILRHQNT